LLENVRVRGVATVVDVMTAGAAVVEDAIVIPEIGALNATRAGISLETAESKIVATSVMKLVTLQETVILLEETAEVAVEEIGMVA